jgi:tRNA threonylcarbamoyladenosine biosynthesis protein TsaB
MLTLAIETSGLAGSVALVRDGELLAERELSQTGRRHARTLVVELRDMLAATQLQPRDCHVIAVSIGPGSFTGLRVGVACAKTFAYATGAHVVGVDTLEAVAANSPGSVHLVDVIADAQRGDVYLATYRRDSAHCWPRETDVRIVALQTWLAERSSEAFVSGPGLETYQAQVPENLRVLPPACWRPHARRVALIAERSASQGRVDDVWRLEPLYIRRSAAEEKRDAVGDAVGDAAASAVVPG